MKLSISLAKTENAKDCMRCIKKSELWDTYFESNVDANEQLRKQIENQNIYVARNRFGKIVGFMGVDLKGCFGKFPYLSIIAVKKKHRGKGVGQMLLETFEAIGFQYANRIFLLVSGFNTKAEKLYQELGFIKVGEIPSLFKDDINENLYVKYNN